MDFQGVIATLASWPADFFLLGILFLIATVDTVRSGSARATTLALSFPVAIVIYSALSSAFLVSSLLQQASSELAQAIIFLLILAITLVLMYRIVSPFSSLSVPIMYALLTAAATIAVAIVCWLSVPALGALWNFSPSLQVLFGEAYRFWWLLISMVALAFVRS